MKNVLGDEKYPTEGCEKKQSIKIRGFVIERPAEVQGRRLREKERQRNTEC